MSRSSRGCTGTTRDQLSSQRRGVEHAQLGPRDPRCSPPDPGGRCRCPGTPSSAVCLETWRPPGPATSSMAAVHKKSISTPSIPNYSSFDFFRSKFDYSSYSKICTKYQFFYCGLLHQYKFFNNDLNLTMFAQIFDE